MKKYIIILSALALIGTGCAKSIPVTENTQPSVEVEAVTENGNVTTSNSLEVIVEPVEGSEAESDDNVVDVVIGNSTDVELNIESSNFAFAPNAITTDPGQKIKITFTKNSGFHTFVIDELDLKFAIKEGESLIFNAPSKSGTYAFYCDVGSHRANGMEGTLVVK